jgi:DNA-directed RNA polymerase specialized sigma24 family protein
VYAGILDDDAARDQSSQELTGPAPQGCRASFAALVHRCAPRREVFLHHQMRDQHESQDPVQDAFVKACENLSRYNDPWWFSTWLVTIATRVAVSRRRPTP